MEDGRAIVQEVRTLVSEMTQMRNALSECRSFVFEEKRRKHGEVRFPDRSFEKRRTQHEYDALKGIGRKLMELAGVLDEEDVLPVRYLREALQLVEERLLTVVVGEEESWKTAKFVADEAPGCWLKDYESAVKEARRKALNAKAKDKKRKATYAFLKEDARPFRKPPAAGWEARPAGSGGPPRVACYNCGGRHFARDCPQRGSRGPPPQSPSGSAQ